MVTAKVLLAHGHRPVIFEQATAFGGQWRLTPPSERDPSATAMYEHLTTNLSTQVMRFSDLSFEAATAGRVTDSPTTFPHHSVMLEYLQGAVLCCAFLHFLLLL
jgi:cation diffusion facilitator CzcD-associated flavoprotein CzcO